MVSRYCGHFGAACSRRDGCAQVSYHLVSTILKGLFTKSNKIFAANGSQWWGSKVNLTGGNKSKSATKCNLTAASKYFFIQILRRRGGKARRWRLRRPPGKVNIWIGRSFHLTSYRIILVSSLNRLYRDGPYMPPPPTDVADPASLQELQVIKVQSSSFYIICWKDFKLSVNLEKMFNPFWRKIYSRLCFVLLIICWNLKVTDGLI